MPDGQARRRRAIVLVGGAVVASLVATGVVWTLRDDQDPVVAAPDFTPSEQVAPPIEVPPLIEAAPAPTPTGFPADAAGYDLSVLPAVGAREVVRALEVDALPGDPALPLSATPVGTTIPVFRTPGEPPVAQMLREQPHDGTLVPVIEQQDHWLKVLLPSRSGLPSEGVVGQQAGWVRAADVTVTTNPYAVSLSLSTGALVVTSAGEPMATLQGFGYGVPNTPTPIGRTYIMTMFTDPGLRYTRGLPVVALAVQSPTLDGFSGQDVAVTAFHYHDARAGAISNGCVRVDEATIRVLAGLPLGTPVMITA